MMQWTTMLDPKGAFRMIPRVLGLMFGFLQASCDEHLPEYRDPRNVLAGRIEGRYLLTLNDNSMKIDIRVINTFDETFEGIALLQGSGSVILKRNQSIGKTFSLSAMHVTNGKYNPVTRLLRMDPYDTLRLVYSWDFLADGGIDLRQTVFRYYNDPTCWFDQPIPVYRSIAFEEMFVIRATLKVFDKIGELSYGPYEFSMCHVNRWVAGNFCPPLLFDGNFCPTQ